MEQGEALTLVDITKRFGQQLALDHASLRVRRGTVHALLGENGAGKTTLMRIAFGLVPPDSGDVYVDAREASFRSPADAIAAGLGMVHQHFTNVAAMSVADNVALGGRGRFSPHDAERVVEEIGRRTGLTLDPAAPAGELPVGAQQRLEIVKALAHDARILILDEPTAVLAPAEASDLLRWLRDYCDRGNTAVIITHKLREALSIADDVTVLRRGRTVLETPAQATTPEQLAEAMVGKPIAVTEGRPSISARREASIVLAKNITLRDRRGVVTISDASFEIRSGEILGIAAVEGAGQRELLRAVAGRLPVAKGALSLPDSIGFIPEDRHRDALVLDFTLSENLALRGAGRGRGRIRWRSLASETERLIKEHDVRGGEPSTPARHLSGGNQQKLVLARELDSHPPLLVAENPSRGLDIQATAMVHDRLREARDAGVAVMLYSGDLDEVLSLASRILVVHAGRVHEVPHDRDVVGRAMLGIQ